MKVWPIITLGTLLYGGLCADGQNIGPRHYDRPHRPASIAYQQFFEQLLTDWTVKDKVITETATDDGDDGEDPGKKLFWTTTHPDIFGVPFTGWADPNPVPNPDPVVPPYSGNLPPGFTVTFTIIDDPKPPDWSNAAADGSTHIQTLNEQMPPAVQRALSLIVSGGATITPCVIALIGGMCPIPCSALTASLPSCQTSGSGGTMPIGGGISPIVSVGGGASASGTPEPSTWVLLGLGFVMLWFVGRRRLSTGLA